MFPPPPNSDDQLERKSEQQVVGRSYPTAPACLAPRTKGLCGRPIARAALGSNYLSVLTMMVKRALIIIVPAARPGAARRKASPQAESRIGGGGGGKCKLCDDQSEEHSSPERETSVRPLQAVSWKAAKK